MQNKSKDVMCLYVETLKALCDTNQLSLQRTSNVGTCGIHWQHHDSINTITELMTNVVVPTPVHITCLHCLFIVHSQLVTHID